MHANYHIISRIKQTVKIPVIVNGGIACFSDIGQALQLTGCDGVMSSEAILEYPALYEPSKIYDMDDLCQEYMDMFEKYPGEADLSIVRAHLFKFLHEGLSEFTELRAELGQAKGIDGLKMIISKMRELRKDKTPEQKLGWYYRHWKGMNLDVKETPTFKTIEWDV